MRQRPTLIFAAFTLILTITPLLFTTPAQDRGVGVRQQPANPVGYHALVIGNNAYTSLPRLKTAGADAREVAALLKEDYGFETTLLLDASRAQIVSALAAYRRKLGPESRLMIYYAGHGYNDREQDKAYWLPVDATADDPANWIISDEITSAIRVIPARQVLVVSDSCYSGTLTRNLNAATAPPTGSERERFLEKMAAGHARMLMASGGNEPVADASGGGHSVFAEALLRGLRGMDRGRFTAAELFRKYVLEPVAGRAEQTPEYNPIRNSGHEGGDFVFVKIKTGSRRAELAVKTPAAVVNPVAIELVFWDAIKNSSDAEDFREYLKKYPVGQFAGIARRRLSSIESKNKSATEPNQPRPNGNTVGEPLNPPQAAPAKPADGSAQAGHVPYPSANYRTYYTSLFRVSLPSNWQQYGSDNNSMTYAPQGAYGAQGITHGVIFSAQQTGYRRNLQSVARGVVSSLLQGTNQYLQQTGDFTNTSVDQREALAVVLSGRSPLTGRNERVTLVITKRSNGDVFYMAAVAPEDEYGTYRRAFDQALRSLQFNDDDDGYRPPL